MMRPPPRVVHGALCAVCLDSLVAAHEGNQARLAPGGGAAGERLLALPCGHCFHARCALPWLGRSRLCPVCRRDAGG